MVDVASSIPFHGSQFSLAPVYPDDSESSRSRRSTSTIPASACDSSSSSSDRVGNMQAMSQDGRPYDRTDVKIVRKRSNSAAYPSSTAPLNSYRERWSADQGRPSTSTYTVPSSQRPTLSLQMPSFLPTSQAGSSSSAQVRQGSSFGWNDGSTSSANSEDNISPCDSSSRTTLQPQYSSPTSYTDNYSKQSAVPMHSAASTTGSASGISQIGRVSLTNTSPLKARTGRRKSSTTSNKPERLVFNLHGDDTSGGEETSTSTEAHQPPHTAVEERATRPALSPYRFPSFSNSAPSLGLAKFPSLGPEPSTSGTRLGLPEGLSLHNEDGSALLRLPLTPLEEVSPMMVLDSPANIVDSGINPFDRIKFTTPSSSSSTASLVQTPRADETFYHALLELVRTEDSYTADLTDLVEVHFNLLAFASFVTEEQRAIIIRDAVRLLEIHQRLQTKLSRVHEDLGWIREHDESHDGVSSPSRRFKSSDATVSEAARRVSSIFLNEADKLQEAYRPFCSAHTEAMEITRSLAATHKYEWESFENQCTQHLFQRQSSSTRLRFGDFIIKPVQQICRYPLLFGNLLKHAPKGEFSRNTERFRDALDMMKSVAKQVDEAQKDRMLEIATVKLALRMDVHTATNAHLLNNLEQVLLVGSAHIIHTDSAVLTANTNVVKASFFGVLLYTTHLVLIRVKKTNVYEPKHWLPLRLFDLHKVPDGEGLLPYAIRMTYRNHTFEIGSLCHQEQNIWAEAIETASLTTRRKFVESVISSPITPPASTLEDSLICSEPLDTTGSLVDTNSPVFSASASDCGGHATCGSPDLASVNISLATAANALAPASSAGIGSDDGHASNSSTVKTRLSLKPPAQRVGVDLRMADLISESVLAARAQSKRSHAMPLHGPPPRSLSTPAQGLLRSSSRPHSFHPGGYFSYRSFVDNTLPRRMSTAESDGGRPRMQKLGSAASTSDSSGATATAPSSPINTNVATPVKPGKLVRSKTSGFGPEATGHKPSRSLTSFSKLRRRANSLRPDTAPPTLVQEFRQESSGSGSGRAKSESGHDSSEAQQASVNRNSSTSSSSSCASSNSTGHSHLLSQVPQIETPQSSLPASPLLTPVDLETHTRWVKISDAITNSLTRKRSFASQRPTLAVSPEPVLEGIQLEQAQKAAEYIYTGNMTNGSLLSRQGTTGWSAGHDRRSSWDAWNRGGKTQSTSTSTAAGRSGPNLMLSAEKRQSSSGSLWSIFRSENNSHTCSPTPSIYESAHEDDEYNTGSGFTTGESTSGEHTPAAMDSPTSASASLPSTSLKPYSTITSSTSGLSGDSHSNSSSSSTLVKPKSNTLSPASAESARPSTLIKRKHSITARLRAFKALGSSMTPMSSAGR